MDFPPLVLWHEFLCEVLGTALNVFMTSMVNGVKIMLMVKPVLPLSCWHDLQISWFKLPINLPSFARNLSPKSLYKSI
jgi:hypothetical protein